MTTAQLAELLAPYSATVPRPPRPPRCTRCGLTGSALIHHATANGHDFTTDAHPKHPRPSRA